MISGGWASSLPMQGAYESMFLPLVDAGFTVFAVRHGSSPRYNVLEAYNDVALAFQKIGAIAPGYGVDPERIGVSGISAGGHLSLMLGLRSDYKPEGDDGSNSHRPAAVVSYMPPTDLRGMTELVAGDPLGERDRRVVGALEQLAQVSAAVLVEQLVLDGGEILRGWRQK